MLSVVCWKWKGRTMGRTRPDYGARHVNVLAASVGRHLRMKHEVVCVTDDPTGIDGSVRIVPLWDDLAEAGRCFRRLKAFAPEMADVLGARFVSIDLDTIICGPLDELFDRPEPFVIWSDPSRVTPYCGSQWMLTAGALPEVWSQLDLAEHATLKARFGYFGSDQAWMAYKAPGAALWTRKDGVYSFRMHIMRQGRGDMPPGLLRRSIRLRGFPKLPADARIVHFHGVYDPSQKIVRDQIPWIAEHWRS